MIRAKKLFSAVDLMRGAAYVKRFHTVPLIGDNTVGQHTFGVMVILCAVVPPAMLRPQLLQAALLHDVPEVVAGDIPSPTKRHVPGVREAFHAYESKILEDAGIVDMSGYLHGYEVEWLTLADSLDGWLFCIDQMKMGNQLIRVPASNFRDYVTEKFARLSRENKSGEAETLANFMRLIDRAENEHRKEFAK